MSKDRQALICRAFAASIDVLGEVAVRALNENLQCADVNLNDFTLQELAAGLRTILGDEATELIFEEIRIRLDELCDERNI